MSRRPKNLYIEVKPTEKLTSSEMKEIAVVASASFGRDDHDEMERDTMVHIEEADQISLARHQGQIVGISMARTLERAQAFEWTGGIILPSYQSGGLMPSLLAAQCLLYGRYELVAHTRSPKIAKILGRMSTEVVPLDEDPVLQELALSIPTSREVNGVVYHFGRYSEDGLYGDDDPASHSMRHGEPPFSQLFPELQDARNSLVLAARMRRNNPI